MADRWMDERDREWRERDWRRSEAYGRGGGDRNRSGLRWGEDRTWTGAGYEDQDPFNDPSQARDQDYEGDDYSGGLGVSSSGSVYSAGRTYGGGEASGRNRASVRYSSQDTDRGYDRPGQGYSSQGSGQGYSGQGYLGQSYSGQRYSDPDYGEAYRAPRMGRAQAYGQERGRWTDEGDRSYARERDRQEHRAMRGDDYERGSYRTPYNRADERGYGAERRQAWREEDRRGDEGRGGEGAGDFLHRAGERISSWFRGENLMRGSRDDDRDQRRYREDFGRESRSMDHGLRGRGPKGYQRSDDRISDEVHQRLTDDPWLDASDIHVEVKAAEVTLSGYVDNREAKHRAERLIEDLSGVRHVQNNLRVNPSAGLTGAGRGYGSSALEAEMRRNEQARDPGNRGASGLSGRTSTGAEAERSSGTAGDGSVDPKTGQKRN